MSADQLLQALESAQLELEFERSLQSAERLYEEERARILRVQLLLLEDENDEAREKIEKDQDDLQRSEDIAQDLHDRFADLEGQYQSTQAELKACMRDIDQYQAEINALNASSTETTKILTAKLALSRELNTLKPELEHLRSQVASQENVLADKLSLQRELNTAQIELENEKKTIQRLKQRNNSEDAHLTDEIETLRKELTEEKKANQKLTKQSSKRANEKSSADAALVDELETIRRDLVQTRQKLEEAEDRSKKNVSSAADQAQLDELRRELSKLQTANMKFEREHLKNSREWSSQKETLESKLDAFRSKLRSTKEQLKQAQDELEKNEAAKFAQSAKLTEARWQGHRETSIQPQTNANLAANPRKRNVARFDPDMTIGTPGNGGPAGAKRARLTMSNVGDKSTFSITPFLNRTQSILVTSPGIDGHEKVDQALNNTINEFAEKADRENASQKERSKSVAAEKREGLDAKKSSSTLGKRSNSEPLSTSDSVQSQPLKGSANARTSKPSKAPTLAKVVEELSDSENQPPPPEVSSSRVSENEVTTSQQTRVNVVKKKKLLGGPRNIFDDDEADGIRRKTALGGAPKLGRIGLGALNRSKPKILAEFSPLKKDRRATAGVTTILEA